MHLQQHRHAVENLDHVDIREAGREQVLAGGLSALCSEDDTILRIQYHDSRTTFITPLVYISLGPRTYNYHNSSSISPSRVRVKVAH
jgi:hypothetical protein